MRYACLISVLVSVCNTATNGGRSSYGQLYQQWQCRRLSEWQPSTLLLLIKLSVEGGQNDTVDKTVNLTALLLQTYFNHIMDILYLLQPYDKYIYVYIYAGHYMIVVFHLGIIGAVMLWCRDCDTVYKMCTFDILHFIGVSVCLTKRS